VVGLWRSYYVGSRKMVRRAQVGVTWSLMFKMEYFAFSQNIINLFLSVKKININAMIMANI
jgi:hypothetical protein